MILLKNLFLSIFLFCCAFQTFCAQSLLDEFKRVGYVEMCNTKHAAATFDALYTYFDEFIQFLQTNPGWAHKLYIAKERFLRCKDKAYYSTDIFGFYDESQRKERSQISFYYSIHFHEFICSCYPECRQIPEITHFLQACYEIQKPYAEVFDQAAAQLNLADIFASTYNCPPILLKIITYLPEYIATKPHYDGSVLTLFLDSTDNQSLLLSPYKSSFAIEDFSTIARTFSRGFHQNSMVLIPGSLVTECAIHPTPHIVLGSGNTRYATIAFAMRPDYIAQKIELADLPSFKH